MILYWNEDTPSSLDPVVNEIIGSGEILKDVLLFRIFHANSEAFDIFRQILVVFRREDGYNMGDTSLSQRIFLENENETLYDVDTKEVLAQTKRWNNSFLLHSLNLSDAAVHLTKRQDKTYQWPILVHQTKLGTAKQTLSTWHKRLGHLNFRSLRSHLKRLNIVYTNKPDNQLVCDSCQRAKATKIYNRYPQERATRPYEFIHTDLIGPLTPQNFGGERYFFTFTDDFTRYTETYTGAQKSDWFRCLKEFYNLAKTRTQRARPTERLRSDYRSEF